MNYLKSFENEDDDFDKKPLSFDERDVMVKVHL